MGIFSGMESASRGYTSNFVQPGRYIARIDDVTCFEKPGVGTLWKNTLTVLSVEAGDEESNRVGEQVQVYFKFDQRWPNMFLGKVKSFIAGVLGVSDDQVGEAEAEEASGENSPLVGLVTTLSAVASPSKRSTNPDGSPKLFTNYSWGRNLSADEIRSALSEEAVNRFFPNGL